MFLAALALSAAIEYRLVYVRESLTGTHATYRQTINGIEVIGGEIVGGGPLPSAAPHAREAAEGSGLPHVYVIVDGVARLARREIVEETRLKRYAHYIDAETGETLRIEPLFFLATARVFDVNPVTKLNDPDLRDQNDAASAVPEQAYDTVELLDLQPFGNLRGPNVQIVDIDEPNPPITDAAQPLLFDREHESFEDVNAYHHIDRTQRYLQSLGYVGARRVVGYAIQVDAHAAEGTDNSFYIPSGPVGQGVLYFGDGGTDDAEDSDLLLHEYGHAIQDWIAPGAFGGPTASESRALGEGFGDYWAFSGTYAGSVAGGRDPFCIAEWDARCAGDAPSERCIYPPGADCLRRVDSALTMADFQRTGGTGTEHRNGQIWSSALREFFLALVARQGIEQGRRAADTIVIESHFGAPPSPTFRAMARKMIDADRLLYGGANASAICAAMTARRIFATGECEALPRGELTYLQSGEQGIAIPDENPTGVTSRLVVQDTRLIERLAVHVDIAHAARGDLRVSLIAPDGTEVTLQDISLDRTADLRATYGLDTPSAQSLDVFRGRSAAGTWTLKVADVLRRDVGTLRSWSLVIQFAGDTPSTSRPASAGARQTIAVAGHVPGANDTLFVTDLRLFNRGTVAREATLIFTPTGTNGLTRFGAVKVSLAPKQVARYDDVVAQQFQTNGTGQLEIIGDDIVATSRVYTRSRGGTYGQFVPATSETVARDESPLFVPQLQNTAAFRSNVGFAEVAGGSGTVNVQFIDASGATIGSRDVEIVPYGHVQFGVEPQSGEMYASIRLVSGAARVLAYGSSVDNISGDAIYIPARRPSERQRNEVAPIIRAPGALGTVWTTDLWLTATAGTREVPLTYVDSRTFLRASTGVLTRRHPDVALSPLGWTEAFGLLTVGTPEGVIATARIATTSERGSFGQFVPLLAEDGPDVVPPGQSRTLLHAESSADFRTNVGIANLDPLSNARVVLITYDADNDEVGRMEQILRPWQLVQIPVANVVNGRVDVVPLEAGRGILAYASVVDNVSGDPILVLPR